MRSFLAESDASKCIFRPEFTSHDGLGPLRQAFRASRDVHVVQLSERLSSLGDKKSGFVKGWFWWTCPRSGFRSGGTCERTLVPVFVPGEHPNVPSFRFLFRGNIRQNHPFWKPPFWVPPIGAGQDFSHQVTDSSCPKIQRPPNGGFQMGGGGLPDPDSSVPICPSLSFFVLFCPFLSFLVLSCPFLSFFVHSCPFCPSLSVPGIFSGIFPICPFPLFFQPINSTYEEQSRKGPRHNPDIFKKKSGKPLGLEPPPRLSFSRKMITHIFIVLGCSFAHVFPCARKRISRGINTKWPSKNNLTYILCELIRQCFCAVELISSGLPE